MGRRLFPLACLLLSFSLPTFAATQWSEVRSQHFKVLTDAGERQGEDVARRFEQMRGMFAALFHKSGVNSPVPLDIVAFRSQDEFIRYVPLWKGKPVSLTGFFEGSDDHDFIGLDMSSSGPFGAVSHEYAHLLLKNNFPVMPLWFEEGFAEYFSTLQVNGVQAEYGAAPQQYATLLANSQWMPITALFSVQHDSPEYNENDRRSIFYAESWLAVHYLMANGRLADAFKYLHLAQIQHVPVADAIQQAFGVDAAGFEKQMRQHLASNPSPSKTALPELNDEPYVRTKVSDFNAQAILADMHAHSTDYQQQALDEFQAVLTADPGNELANRGLGYWYVRNGRFDEASQVFQKALAANQNDAQLHYLVAYLINRKALKTGAAPRDVLAMRTELETAIQLDSSLADAHNLLAFALASDHKYDLAIASEKKAIALNPSEESYQANLGHIYTQAGMWDEGEAVLKRLELSGNSKIHDDATQNLAALKAQREQATVKQHARAMGVSDPTAPQWKMTPEVQSEDAQANADQTEKFDTRKTQYFTGELEAIDCSRKPVAVLTVRKGPKLMKLRTEDYNKLIVMGADSFSCDWRDRKVLINYKPGGKSDGDLVTLEIEAAVR